MVTLVTVCKVVALHTAFPSSKLGVCKATTLHTVTKVTVYVET